MVFQGNHVKDVEGVAAVFAELSSSATLMSASKLLDAVAMLPGNAGEQSDVEQAYTQARFGHGQQNPVETWVRLPKDRWPQNWHGRYNDPVVCPPSAGTLRTPVVRGLLGTALPRGSAVRRLHASSRLGVCLYAQGPQACIGCACG